MSDTFTARVPVNEYRRPDGTVLARWLGEGGTYFPTGLLPDEFEIWRDGEMLARYWRDPSRSGADGGPVGWSWEVPAPREAA